MTPTPNARQALVARLEQFLAAVGLRPESFPLTRHEAADVLALLRADEAEPTAMLREVLERLVSALDVCAPHIEVHDKVHGSRYNRPTFDKELEAAKAALAAIR